LTAEQLALGATLTEQVPNPFFGQVPESSSLGGPTVARQQLLRPFPRFTTVAFYRKNVGHSTYHSFQSRLERRFSASLSLTAAYTFNTPSLMAPNVNFGNAAFGTITRAFDPRVFEFVMKVHF